MRRLLLAAVMLGTACGAQAADMPDFLRGGFTAPVARTNWQGFYVGGQAGYGANMNFTNSDQDLLTEAAQQRRRRATVRHLELAAAGKRPSTQTAGSAASPATTRSGTTSSSASKLNYIHGKFFGSSQQQHRAARSSIPPTIRPPRCGRSSAAMQRSRTSVRCASAAAMPRQLPALCVRRRRPWAGRLSTARAESTCSTICRHTDPARCPIIGPSVRSLTDNANTHFIYGYSGGLGIDVMLFGGSVPARRIGIHALHLAGRHQHQHRARRHRLQVLIRADVAHPC